MKFKRSIIPAILIIFLATGCASNSSDSDTRDIGVEVSHTPISTEKTVLEDVSVTQELSVSNQQIFTAQEYISGVQRNIIAGTPDDATIAELLETIAYGFSEEYGFEGFGWNFISQEAEINFVTYRDTMWVEDSEMNFTITFSVDNRFNATIVEIKDDIFGLSQTKEEIDSFLELMFIQFEEFKDYEWDLDEDLHEGNYGGFDFVDEDYYKQLAVPYPEIRDYFTYPLSMEEAMMILEIYWSDGSTEDVSYNIYYADHRDEYINASDEYFYAFTIRLEIPDVDYSEYFLVSSSDGIVYYGNFEPAE